MTYHETRTHTWFIIRITSIWLKELPCHLFLITKTLRDFLIIRTFVGKLSNGIYVLHYSDYHGGTALCLCQRSGPSGCQGVIEIMKKGEKRVSACRRVAAVDWT